MEHQPVLLAECIDGLDIKPEGIYVDGTLGRGGHTGEIAKRLTTGRIIAIDRDLEAINEAAGILGDYIDKISFFHGNFSEIDNILDLEDIGAVDGMLFDLGVSSPQLDSSERGFSYMQDAPLDMRMNQQDDLTAFEAVNFWSQARLRQIFREYGEERYAGAIAGAIVRKREIFQIKTTFQLNEIIYSAIPVAARREAQHPAKRCYQALRIAINDELESLKSMLETAPNRLKTGGRICVVSFHSLEDRLVKRAFAAQAAGCRCPKNIPVCICGIPKTLKLVTKKPISPGKEETERNPRSRSAKLRVAQRI